MHTFKEFIEGFSPEERARIELESDIIVKMAQAREEKGISQRELAKMSGVKQPAIARIESLKTNPQLDTLLKLLIPLGYTLTITPLDKNNL